MEEPKTHQKVQSRRLGETTLEGERKGRADDIWS